MPGGNLDADGPNPWGARAFQFWCWTTLVWDRARAGRPVLSCTRSMEVDLSGYDLLIVCLMVSADIDGHTRTLMDREPGRIDSHEYEAPVEGWVLRRLTLTFESDLERPEEAWLCWIGVANRSRRAAMLARPHSFSPAWDGELRPPGTPVDLAPRFGFFFDAAGLEAVRRRALSPLYRPIMDQLRARARAAMSAATTPEDQVGSYHTSWQWKLLIREREYGHRPFYIDGPICGFVGLVDRDPEVSRFAARIAMSLAHTDHWHYTFQQGFPGSTWDIRGFPEAFVTGSIAMIADWAGCWITPKAEHLLRFSVATRGLPKVREVMLQWDYLWDCNQSHMIGLGRVLGLLLLERAWPRTGDDIG